MMRPGDSPSPNGRRSTSLEGAIDLAGMFDSAVNRLYSAGLSIAAVLGGPDVGDHVAAHLNDALESLDGVVGDLRTAAFDGRAGIVISGLDSSVLLYLEDSFVRPAPLPPSAPAQAVTSDPPVTTSEDVIE